MLRGRRGKTLFWFSSLDQIIQIETIKFCRNFKNYFGQFVWIEKSHYNSRVSLHEAPTKNGPQSEQNHILTAQLFLKIISSRQMSQNNQFTDFQLKSSTQIHVLLLDKWQQYSTIRK